MSDVIAGAIACLGCGTALQFESVIAGGDAVEFWGAPCHLPEYFEHQVIGLGAANECPACGTSFDEPARLAALEALCDVEVERLARSYDTDPNPYLNEELSDATPAVGCPDSPLGLRVEPDRAGPRPGLPGETPAPAPSSGPAAGTRSDPRRLDLPHTVTGREACSS